MVTTTPDFGSVQLSCAKPGCSNPRLQRHHKKHEYIWVAVWVKRRMGEPRFQAFSRRYWSFDDRDIVRICARHHVEVHAAYTRIIDQHIVKNSNPLLHTWTWKEADALMKDLEEYCDKWLKKKTPGLNTKSYKRKRRKK